VTRHSLGAQAADILGLFVRRGLALAGVGVAIGLGGAAGFTRWMRSLLFGISPLDPITFAAFPSCSRQLRCSPPICRRTARCQLIPSKL
jgi:ABC-type lipoprotein release transport system permease subunit